MSGHKNRIRRQNAAFILPRGLFAGIRPAQNLLDLKHGGGLHNIFHAARVVDAGQLHQNLILAESMFLNRRFAHAQRIDSIADSLDRLRHRLILYVGEHRRLHGQRPGVIGPRTQVVLGQALGNDIE